MTQAAIAAQVHQSLDVHRDVAAQIAFDHELADLVAQALHLGVVEVLDLLGRSYLGGFADEARAGTTDAEDRGQADVGVLVIGDVDAGDTGHARSYLLDVWVRMTRCFKSRSVSLDAACGADRRRSRAPRRCA